LSEDCLCSSTRIILIQTLLIADISLLRAKFLQARELAKLTISCQNCPNCNRVVGKSLSVLPIHNEHHCFDDEGVQPI